MCEEANLADGQDAKPGGSGSPSATYCDFCGRPTPQAGPMVEGKALVDAGAIGCAGWARGGASADCIRPGAD